jgi:hypothetical protein
MARPRTDIYKLRARDFLKTHLQETVKSHMVWDGSGRMATHYTADADSADGDPCIRTDYQYDGTTGRTTGMKESLSTWDEDWDF